MARVISKLPPVVLKRKMQFTGGPHVCEFFACGIHKHYIETGDVQNFLILEDEPARMCDAEDAANYECDFHREG